MNFHKTAWLQAMQKVYIQPWEWNLWTLWQTDEKSDRHWASHRIVAKQWQSGWGWQLTILQSFDRTRTYMRCQSSFPCHFQFVLLLEDIRPRWHLQYSYQCHWAKDRQHQRSRARWYMQLFWWCLWKAQGWNGGEVLQDVLCSEGKPSEKWTEAQSSRWGRGWSCGLDMHWIYQAFWLAYLPDNFGTENPRVLLKYCGPWFLGHAKLINKLWAIWFLGLHVQSLWGRPDTLFRREENDAAKPAWDISKTRELNSPVWACCDCVPSSCSDSMASFVCTIVFSICKVLPGKANHVLMASVMAVVSWVLVLSARMCSQQHLTEKAADGREGENTVFFQVCLGYI